MSVSRACRLVGLPRSLWYREDPSERQARRDAPVTDALNAVLERNGSWGFWKCHWALYRQGFVCNHKRLWRVYCAMGLNQKRRAKKRLPNRPRQPLTVPPESNHTWSFDFMSDALYSGMRYRVLNIMDEGVREALDIVVDTSIPAARVVRSLEQLRCTRGLPRRIRVDNGPEMLAGVFTEWCRDHAVELVYIQPGKPNQNAYIERFNRSFRAEVLNRYLFTSLAEVRELSAAWLISYNEERPHASLGNIPPAVFRRQISGEMSTYELST